MPSPSQHQIRAELEAMVLGDLLRSAGGAAKERTERTVWDRYGGGDLAPSRVMSEVAPGTGQPMSSFGTHDWMIFAQAARGEKIPANLRYRLKRLIDLGMVERGPGKTYILARKYYEFAGQRGTYTRKKGLDRDQNLALLVKHIEENKSRGTKLEELCQVLPALARTQVQSLLKTLKRRGTVHSRGQKKAGLWFPGPALMRIEETKDGV